MSRGVGRALKGGGGRVLRLNFKIEFLSHFYQF